MKVAILAGGKGTRLADPTDKDGIVPKPMVTIGSEPILKHVIDHYEDYGHKDFTIACGYLAEKIKAYFESADLNLKVTCVDTGLDTNTGGRIKRLKPYLVNEATGVNETFMLTWGDGLSDVNLDKLLAFHKSHGKLCTLTAVHPPARFGELTIEGDAITQFNEKPKVLNSWINGAFFVCEPGIFDYIEGDETLFEGAPLENLAKDNQLMAYKHEGFWQCMDTPKDRDELREMFDKGITPWKENNE
ncbi:MAG: sugar phosphate nucleotidyltransferase [Acidimicrobiia bacterium]